MATRGTEGEGADEVIAVRGPHGWVNWNAERDGQPARETRHPDAVVIEPRWAEYVLYSDAEIRGEWPVLGPFTIQSLMTIQAARIGVARRSLLLRYRSHLSDAPGNSVPLKTDVADYVGGDLDVEIAALLGLALGRRIRSGGLTRRDLGDSYPLGLAIEDQHHPPYLEPPLRQPMIWWVADPADLSDALDLLNRYPDLERADAVALVRAARQYVDGLWYADLDPAIAWLKLIGALETASVRSDNSRDDSKLDQLARHNPGLRDLLNGVDADVAEQIAAKVSSLFKAQEKVLDFVERYKCEPPTVRPDPVLQCDWSEIDSMFRTIYSHRSDELHEGIAFPWPLRAPPLPDFAGPVPPERFAALAMSGQGGQWSAEDLPIYLHVFAHLVGGTLRNWWGSLGEADAAP